jgi:hypothetical protein
MVTQHTMVVRPQGQASGTEQRSISLRYHCNAHHMRTLMPWILAHSIWCHHTVPRMANPFAHSSDTARSCRRRQHVWRSVATHMTLLQHVKKCI